MSVIGKGTTSLRKKDLESQRTTALGFKKMVFYHKATAGDTGINLSALSMPSELSSLGKSNPSSTALGAAKLYFYQDNLILSSSLRGFLQPGSYLITGSTQIVFNGFTAEQDEIFIGTIDPVAMTALRATDARALVASGTLAVGSTDFAVGDAFETNLYPTTQMGAVLVFRNGVLQMRNVGNATAATTADGNYQEVPTSGTTSNTIRFNVAAAGPDADAIVVVSNGLLVERPTDSQMALIESVSGRVESLATVLADVAGVDKTSTFGSNPTSVDLRTFGDDVITMKSRTAYLATQQLTNLKQYTLTVTGTNWTTTRAVGIPYKTATGEWRLKFNIVGAVSSGTDNFLNLTVANITFKSGYDQAVSIFTSTRQGNSVINEAVTLSNSSTIQILRSSSASLVLTWSLSGDVELNAMPSFAL